MDRAESANQKEARWLVEPDKPSRTALIAAFIRAHHHAYDHPSIFEDPYAHLLLTASQREFIETIAIDTVTKLDPKSVESCPDRAAVLSLALRSGASPGWILARARYAEEKLAEVVEGPVRQYVLLGAGLDMFAFGRSDLRELVQVFEIDQVATQAFKRQRPSEAGLELPPNLHFAAADFEREKVAHRLRLAMDTARRQGEPLISGFDPERAGSELSQVGFRILEDLGLKTYRRATSGIALMAGVRPSTYTSSARMSPAVEGGLTIPPTVLFRADRVIK
ncbi:MAG: class I SAM-dependent methyltransferase [Candidatus Methylomirabilia bacterium]